MTDQTYIDTSPKSKINGYMVSQNVLAAIREASTAVGIEFGFLMAMAAQESGFNPNARPPINPATGQRYSSALGLYQFLDATWAQMVQVYGAQYGIGPDDRTTPRASALIGAQYSKDNAAYLGRHGITQVGDAEMYIAHFLGQGGATEFLSAYYRDSTQSAANIVPAAARANPTVFYRNGTPKSLADVYAFYQNKITPMATAFQNV
jgi:hypothetical protein